MGDPEIEIARYEYLLQYNRLANGLQAELCCIVCSLLL
jgi:hypothetical protein